LRETAERRLLSSFDTVVDEAMAIAEEELERLKELHKDDPSRQVFFEEAWEEGRSHWQDMEAIKDAVTNMLVAALFHLFEQQLDGLARQVSPDFAKKQSMRSLHEAATALESAGLACFSFSCWPTLIELRLVANTIKHGEGRSSRELVEKRPKFFPRDSFFQPFIGQPLTGHGFAVLQPQFSSYFDAAMRFWDEAMIALLGGAEC